MRMTIIREDNFISVDGKGYFDFDMSWVPTYNGVPVHAVQWYDDHGEIELESRDSNIEIVDLGSFNEAYRLWKERDDYVKEQFLLSEQQRLEEEKILEQERQQREEFLALFDEEIRTLLEEEKL